jgi:hypothetical protein
MPESQEGRTSLVRAIVPVWLVTAAWDFICASALGYFAYDTPVPRFWRGVASVGFGPSVLKAGGVGTAKGVLLHLLVALMWSTIFVVAARNWPALREKIRTPAGAIAVAAAYGPMIWLVMSLLVIPFASGRPPKFGFRWWVQIFAHIPFVTIPLVFTARRVLRSNR